MLNVKNDRIAEARERWNKSMKQMGLNYTLQEFLMLNNDKINSKVYELYINKKMT